MIGKKCLNCGYVRTVDDIHFAVGFCPKCHKVYAKVEQRINNANYEAELKARINSRRYPAGKSPIVSEAFKDKALSFVGVMLFVGAMYLMFSWFWFVDNSTTRNVDPITSQFSSFDGSHRKVEQVVIASLKNPSSYEHVNTKFIKVEDGLVITTTYRATNSFNAVVTETHSFITKLNGDVVTMLN